MPRTTMACSLKARSLRAASAIAITATILALPPIGAWAQSASQLTPPSFRPPAASGGVVVGTPEQAPLQAPADAAGLTVRIAAVTVKGLFKELAADAEVIISKAKGRRLTVSQLYEIAGAIEALHVGAGYVLARVTVPQQEIVDGGTFVIEVIDGFIEEVKGDALPDRVRNVVLSRVDSLVGKRHLMLAELERRVLLAGDVPGIQLTSTLARGSKPGGTKLILQAVYNPVQGTLITENRLNPALGNRQHTASASINSALGLGELVYGSIAGSGDIFQEESRLKMYAAGVVLPLSSDGLTFNAEYVLTSSKPLPPAGVPATEDRFERIAARVAYPFIRTRAVTLSAQTAYEHITQQTEALAFGALLSLDRYDLIRNSLTASASNGAGGSVYLSAQLSNGLTGRNRADAAAENVPLSRQNAKPHFSKISGEMTVAQLLPEQFRLQVSARGQASMSGALLRGEQMSLDSSDVLTGWTSGTFLVDQGVAGRVELQRRFDLSRHGWLSAATPYVFAAFGHGQLLSPTAVERAAVTARSIGFGARGAVELPGNRYGAFTGLELAKRFTDDPDKPEDWRGVISFGIKF